MNKFRLWMRKIHRDLGFLSVGLVLIYAISGVALNHINDWNPNYSIERSTFSIVQTDIDAEALRSLFSIEGQLMTQFDESPDRIKFFFKNNTTVVFDRKQMMAEMEKVSPRPVLYWMNRLHLNQFKGAWTLFADLFALTLIILALSGLFLAKGKWGLSIRAWFFLLLGVTGPSAFLLTYLF